MALESELEERGQRVESPQDRGNHLARTPLPQKGAVGAGSQGLPTLGKGPSETYRTT